MRAARWSLFVLACSVGLSAPARSVVEVPFLEDFTADASGWKNATVLDVDFEAAGGPDGGSHIQTSFSYFGFSNPFGGGPVIFRAQDEFDASGGAFEGDWLADGVGQVTAFVRHDTGEDLNYFLRIATAFNAPGAVFVDDATVPSGVWTQVTWTIDADSPLCFGEGIPCAEALADVGHLQIGTDAPESLVALETSFTLELDKVEVERARAGAGSARRRRRPRARRGTQAGRRPARSEPQASEVPGDGDLSAVSLTSPAGVRRQSVSR